MSISERTELNNQSTKPLNILKGINFKIKEGKPHGKRNLKKKKRKSGRYNINKQRFDFKIADEIADEDNF